MPSEAGIADCRVPECNRKTVPHCGTCNRKCFEFTLTRIFIKLFRTGSLVNDCHVSFGFLRAKSQILIRTASFLQRFAVSENSLCMVFANDARRQLHSVFMQVGDNVRTARQLRSAVFAKLFDGS